MQGTAMTDTLTNCCATCVHFQPLIGTSLGTCGHPARQSLTDVTVSVRRRQLPCRIAWALSYWRPAPEQTVHVTDILVWGPFVEDAAEDDLPGDLIGFLLLAGETDD